MEGNTARLIWLTDHATKRRTVSQTLGCHGGKRKSRIIRAKSHIIKRISKPGPSLNSCNEAYSTGPPKNNIIR
jgi:hypothetical protein